MGNNKIVFLGILLDGQKQVLAIPEDKKTRALAQLNLMVNKKLAQVKHLQQLAGLLNFLNHAIMPGRAFTRRMYAKFSGFTKVGSVTCKDQNKKEERTILKPHYYVRLDAEFKDDCRMWIKFLSQSDQCIPVLRPFADLAEDKSAAHLQFFSDASAAISTGFGCYYNGQFTFGMWSTGFIENCKPSIAYLELYALCVAVFIWSNELCNCRVVIACDNIAAVNMVNNTTSSCKNCIVLIRLLTL